MHNKKLGLSSRSLAVALLLAGGAAGAKAQSLVELYEAARSFDATYLAAQLQFRATQSAVEGRKGINRPLVTAQASAAKVDIDGSTRSETVSATPGATASQYASSTQTAGSSSSASQTESKLSLSAQQPLFNRANDIAIEQAQRALAQAELSVRQAEQELIVKVTQSYFDVLASQDNLNLLKAQKAAIAEQLASAKRRFEVGTATIIDTREAQAAYDLILAQEIAANGDLAVRKSALEQLVGRDAVAPHPLKPAPTFPELDANEQRWTQQAEANLQFQTRKLELDIARLETRKAQAGHLPTVALVAGLTRTLPSGSSVATGYSNISGITGAGTAANSQTTSRQSTWPGNNTNASLGVQVSVPIFSGYSVQNRIKETLALEEKAEKDLAGSQRTATQNIRSLFYKLMADQGQVKALEAAELSRQSALQSNLLGYQVGVGTNIDVLNSQTQLFQTRRDLARAKYDVLVGGLRLKQAAGSLGASDLQAVNAQLLKP